MSRVDPQLPGPLLSERADADELAWRELVHDQLRSLRTGMVLLGTLAVVALGVALWSLLSVQSADDVIAARVRQLERRVEEIRSDLRQTPSSAALTSLRAQQQSLDKQVASLADRVQRVEQSSTELKLALNTLQQRVDDLESQPPQETP